MRTVERITVLLFAVVLLAFLGVKAYGIFIKDTKPPVISCDSDEIDVPILATDRALLKGVTATDNRDGDLTDKIIIQGITQLLTDNTARITYAVFDSADNMATCQRTIRYTDYEKPHFILSKPLIYRVGSQISVLDRLSAVDSANRDISKNIRVTAQNINTSYEGTYTMTVQVTNSMGDTASLTLPVIISNEAAKHQCVELSEYIVYQDAGQRFNPYNYVQRVSDAQGNVATSAEVEIVSNVEPDVPGVYEVSYTYQNDTVYQTVVIK